MRWAILGWLAAAETPQEAEAAKGDDPVIALAAAADGTVFYQGCKSGRVLGWNLTSAALRAERVETGYATTTTTTTTTTVVVAVARAAGAGPPAAPPSAPLGVASKMPPMPEGGDEILAENEAEAEKEGAVPVKIVKPVIEDPATPTPAPTPHEPPDIEVQEHNEEPPDMIHLKTAPNFSTMKGYGSLAQLRREAPGTEYLAKYTVPLAWGMVKEEKLSEEDEANRAAEEGRLIHRDDMEVSKVMEVEHSSEVYALALSEDKRLLFTGGRDGRVLCWDAAGHEALPLAQASHGGPVRALLASRHVPGVVFSAGDDGRVVGWKWPEPPVEEAVADPELMRKPVGPQASAEMMLAARDAAAAARKQTPYDGNLTVTADGDVVNDYGVVLTDLRQPAEPGGGQLPPLPNVAQLEQVGKAWKHGARVNALAEVVLQTGEALVFSGGTDKRTVAWHASGKASGALAHPAAVTALAVGGEGPPWVYAGDDQGGVRIYDAAALPPPKFTAEPLADAALPTTALRVTVEGNATGDEEPSAEGGNATGGYELIESMPPNASFHFGASVGSLAASPDGRSVWAAGWTATPDLRYIRTWTRAAGESHWKEGLQMPAPSWDNALALGGGLLFAGDQRGEVTLYDAYTDPYLEAQATKVAAYTVDGGGQRSWKWQSTTTTTTTSLSEEEKLLVRQMEKEKFAQDDPELAKADDAAAAALKKSMQGVEAPSSVGDAAEQAEVAAENAEENERREDAVEAAKAKEAARAKKEQLEDDAFRKTTPEPAENAGGLPDNNPDGEGGEAHPGPVPPAGVDEGAAGSAGAPPGLSAGGAAPGAGMPDGGAAPGPGMGTPSGGLGPGAPPGSLMSRRARRSVRRSSSARP